jgi:hypothetical protein
MTDTIILNGIDQIDKKTRLNVLKILQKNNVRIYEHSDGCRVNLNTVPNDIKNEICTIIKFNLELAKESWNM